MLGNLEITYIGITKSLEDLNTKKAVGPDAIPNLFLEGCNCSIFKKGDRHQTQNYRPVSLTSISCKILEHIIVKHILNHFDLHKIFTKFQHGFRSGLSCETQLLETTNDFLSTLDAGERVDVAILDFSKAFDTVPNVDYWQS